MGRISSILFLVVVVVLLIPTGLVLVSQNAIPGDSNYSIKRSLEKVILSIASLHPSTKAYFHADLMNRRYKEAVALIEKGANASESLQELVAQTGTAAQVASALTDNKQKGQYIDQLSKSIDQYEIKLAQIENTVAPTPKPVTILTPSPLPSPVTTAQEPTTQPTPIVSSPPTIGPPPSIASPKPLPEVKPPPTVSPHPSTPIPSVEPTPTFQPQPIYQTPPVKLEPDKERKIQDIDEAKRKLKEIKRRLDDEKEKLEEQNDNRKVSLEERDRKGKKVEQKSLKDKEKD